MMLELHQLYELWAHPMVRAHRKKVSHYSLIVVIGGALAKDGGGMADWLFLILAIVCEFD